jgi:uncharacterized membrane protein YjjP (DUF1212 family)
LNVPGPAETATASPAEALIVELARSLHASGSPAYELDRRMENVAAVLGHPASFFSTPTALFVTFTHEQGHTRLLRVYPSDTNLGRYAELYAILRAIEDDQISVMDAWQRLRALESRPHTYHGLIQILAFGFAAASVGLLVGGNMVVVIAAGMIGLLVGIVQLALGGSQDRVHFINILAGFLASVIASVLQSQVANGNVILTSLAAVVVLLPGLQLTISINELATQNLASGSARFAGAMTSLLTLVFGVYMGHTLVSALLTVPPSLPPQSPTILTSLVSLLPIGLSLGVLFQARYRDLVWVLAAAFIGYGSMRLAGQWLKPFAAVWAASVVVGLCSHMIASYRDLPVAITLMPGLILLVPGSLGFFGLSAIMLSDDLPHGIGYVATMILTAVSIVAGLLITDVLVSAFTRSVRR